MQILSKHTFQHNCSHCGALLEIENLDLSYDTEEERFWCRCAACEQAFNIPVKSIPHEIVQGVLYRFVLIE